MKIKRINRITDIGIYKDFSWKNENLSDFKDFNLIFGWNYSGKTTLSRIFDCLRDPKMAARLGGTFELVDENGINFDSKNILESQNCRVFNRDFIEKNFLQSDFHKAPAVFIVGDKAANIRRSIDNLKSRKRKVDLIATRSGEGIKGWDHRVNDGLKREAARSIGSLVGEPRTYLRPDLDKTLEAVKAAPTDYLLEDTDVAGLVDTIQSGDKLETHDGFKIPDLDMSALIGNVGDLLGETASNLAISQLRDDARLEDWVRTGRNIHAVGDECAFCGNNIQNERL